VNSEDTKAKRSHYLKVFEDNWLIIRALNYADKTTTRKYVVFFTVWVQRRWTSLWFISFVSKKIWKHIEGCPQRCWSLYRFAGNYLR